MTNRKTGSPETGVGGCGAYRKALASLGTRHLTHAQPRPSTRFAGLLLSLALSAIPVHAQVPGAAITLSESSLTVGEGGGTGTYTVRLAAAPSATVTVTLTASRTDAVAGAANATTSPESLTFTTGNWGTVQTVTVTGTMDDDDADSAVKITHTAAGGGYAGVTKDLAVTVTEGICGRTEQVRTFIVGRTSVSACGAVTDTHLAAITYISLLTANITALQAGDFAGLTAVKAILVGDNPLTALPAGIFNGLTALERLHLYENEFTSLRADVFTGLTALKHLDLGGNDLTALPADIFDGLTALEELELYRNPIASLRADAFTGLTALKTLRLTENPFTTLPAGIFSGLTALRALHLTKTGLTTLKADQFSGLNLERLDMFDIPGLTSIEAGVFNGLTVTEELEIVNARNLATLRSGAFRGLTTKQLAVRRTGITTIEAGAFEGLTGVESLWMHGSSRLTTLPDGAFRNLSVTNLILSETGITTIQPGAFNGLTVDDLWLQSNNIATLAPESFRGLTLNRLLFLQKNRLSSLPGGLFKGLTGLDHLWLHDNPMDNAPALQLTVSLVPVAGQAGQFKVKVPAGAPFDITVQVSITNGGVPDPNTPGSTISALPVTVSTGTVESGAFTVSRTSGTTDAVTADITGTLPGLPTGTFDITYLPSSQTGLRSHRGYELIKSTSLPLTVIDGEGNNAPSFTSPASFSAKENQTAAGTVVATDEDTDDSVTGYTLTGGADQDLFEIDDSSGVLTFKTAPDFENPADVASTTPPNDADNNEYIVEVTATSGTGGRVKTTAQTITVTVTDVTTVHDATYCANTIWCGTLTVGSAGIYGPGYSGTPAFGALSDDDFDFGGTTRTVRALQSASQLLQLRLSPFVPASQAGGLTLHVGTTALAFSGADAHEVTSIYSWTNHGVSWSDGDETAVKITRAGNNAATGTPVITKGDSTALDAAPRAEDTLAVDVSGIGDADGLPDKDGDSVLGEAEDFDYQWFRVDSGTETPIANATNATYTATDDDVGKTLKVKVSFTDALLWDEEVESAETAAVAAAAVKVTGLERAFTGDTPGQSTKPEYSIPGDRLFLVAIGFSQVVTGFEAAEVTVVNGEAVRFENCPGATPGRIYCVFIRANGEDGETLRVSIPEDVVDGGNAASSGELGTGYWEGTISRTTLTAAFGSVAEPVTGRIELLVTFSDPILSSVTSGGHVETFVYPEADYFALADVGVTNGQVRRLTTDVDVANGYRVQIDPKPGFEGTMTVTLPAGAVKTDNGAGNPRVSKDIEVDLKPPELQTATVDGTTMELTWHEELDTSSEPAAGRFTLFEGASDTTGRAATGITLSGKVVTLTFGKAVAAGSEVFVTYAKPSTNPLQDAAGHDAAGLSRRAVTNETPPAVSIADSAASENAGTMDFSVTLSAAHHQEVAVDWRTSTESGDTAVANTDYTTANGTLTLETGETHGTVSVQIADDTSNNGARTFTVTLSNPTGGAELDTDHTSATGTILDDEGSGEQDIDIWIEDGVQVESDSDGMMQFAVKLSETYPWRDISVTYTTSPGTATAGEDYTHKSGTLTFKAREGCCDPIEIPIIDDSEDEEKTETFTLTLSDPQGASLTGASATGTIYDDDVDDTGIELHIDVWSDHLNDDGTVRLYDDKFMVQFIFQHPERPFTGIAMTGFDATDVTTTGNANFRFIPPAGTGVQGQFANMEVTPNDVNSFDVTISVAAKAALGTDTTGQGLGDYSSTGNTAASLRVQHDQQVPVSLSARAGIDVVITAPGSKKQGRIVRDADGGFDVDIAFVDPTQPVVGIPVTDFTPGNVEVTGGQGGRPVQRRELPGRGIPPADHSGPGSGRGDGHRSGGGGGGEGRCVEHQRRGERDVQTGTGRTADGALRGPAVLARRRQLRLPDRLQRRRRRRRGRDAGRHARGERRRGERGGPRRRRGRPVALHRGAVRRRRRRDRTAGRAGLRRGGGDLHGRRPAALDRRSGAGHRPAAA